MTRCTETILAELPQRSLAVRAAVLGMAVLLVAAGLAPVAGVRSGWAGLCAAGAAAAVCLIGAVAALAISHVLRGPAFVLPALLLGMMVRMGLPLALALIYQFWGGGLADAGFLVYLLVFYPVTLTVETILSLPPGNVASRAASSPRPQLGDPWTS